MTLPTRITSDIIQEAPTTHVMLDKYFINAISGATPSALNRTTLRCNNAAPVTVTDFTGGQEGQTFKLLGDGNTTISNNSNIKTNTGANKLVLADIVYTFTLFSGVWIEDE